MHTMAVMQRPHPFLSQNFLPVLFCLLFCPLRPSMQPFLPPSPLPSSAFYVAPSSAFSAALSSSFSAACSSSFYAPLSSACASAWFTILLIGPVPAPGYRRYPACCPISPQISNDNYNLAFYRSEPCDLRSDMISQTSFPQIVHLLLELSYNSKLSSDRRPRTWIKSKKTARKSRSSLHFRPLAAVDIHSIHYFYPQNDRLKSL